MLRCRTPDRCTGRQRRQRGTMRHALGPRLSRRRRIVGRAIAVSTRSGSSVNRRTGGTMAAEPHRLMCSIKRLGLATVVGGVLVLTSVGEAAQYDTRIGAVGNQDYLDLRTLQRSPGHWFVELDRLEWHVACPSGRTDLFFLDRGDVRPAVVPIRRGRFRATLRQLDFEVDAFVRSGTLVLSGRFGPRRASGSRALSGSISARRVGEGGTVCRAQARFRGIHDPSTPYAVASRQLRH